MRRPARSPRPRTGIGASTGAVALAAALLASSCGPAADFAAISRGNRLHELGRHQDAILAYLGVRGASFGPTVDYDLANSYARLGEARAAAELYEASRRGEDRGLRADAHFNEGVALYEKGRYEEAWRSFKEALSLCLDEPASLPEDFAGEARKNLELSWRAWKKRSLVPPRGAVPSVQRGEGRDEEELRLLRRLETRRWRPGSRARPEDLRGDY